MAVVAALQVAEKQQLIMNTGLEKDGTNQKANYHRVAFGAYPNGALREATHADYDDVARSSAVVCSGAPECPYPQYDSDGTTTGWPSWFTGNF